MKSVSILAFLVATQFAMSTVPASADARRGELLARRWCVDCHVVAANQSRPTSEAPPFASIANRSNFNAENLAFFLLSPHPKMPNMSLTRSEAIDLALYIASLKR